MRWVGAGLWCLAAVLLGAGAYIVVHVPPRSVRIGFLLARGLVGGVLYLAAVVYVAWLGGQLWKGMPHPWRRLAGLLLVLPLLVVGALFLGRASMLTPDIRFHLDVTVPARANDEGRGLDSK